MFDRFIITTHFVEQYADRLYCKPEEVKKKVAYDLSVKMVRRIVNIGSKRHVYTRNNREFIFCFDKRKKRWIAKTVIKHSRFKIDEAISKRLSQQEEYRKEAK